MQQRSFWTLPGAGMGLEELQHEALRVLQAKQVSCVFYEAMK